MTFRCPTCRRRVAREAPTFPFCRERCRDVDLCRWFEESYRVPGPSLADDDDSEDGWAPRREDPDE